ncbi:MAG TPA: cell division protein FtsX [Bacteroidales bacterium]|nr:cell division protein FtsX [Bacteroidales bacterium]
MLKNFFVNGLRIFRKNPGYIALNVSGLAIGLAGFLFIILYVINELSYDRFHKNYENIYRLKVVGRMAGGEIDQAVTAAPMARAMVADYPEVLEATRFTSMGEWLIRFGENRFNEDGVLFADSSIFKVFSFRLLKGDPASALERPKSLILTEEYAKKYFGDMDPMGQKMIVEADTNLYTVTGVIQNIPDNSHIKFDILASLSSYPQQANNQFWVSHNCYTYILVKNGTVKADLEEKFQGMVVKYVGPQLKQILGLTIEDFKKAGNDFKYVMEPLKDIHMKGASQYSLEPGGSLTTIYIFSVIALLILLTAIINYVNLATAKSASRAKEVGVKKVAGAGKTGLMAQFLGESLIIAAFAAFIAIILVFVLLPSFNQLTGKEVSAGQLQSLQGIALLAGLVIFTGVASGFYPGFVLASFNPVEVLKGTLNPGSVSKKLRRLLVIFQFTVSIAIIIGSIIVYRQLNFMTNKDLGFNKDNLIIIRRADSFFRQRESFREQLINMPGIENVGFSRAVPGGVYNNNGFLKDEDPEKNTYLMNQTQVSYDFPQTLGVQLVKGRFFSKEFGTDSTAILINEAAAKSLGMTDPVGKYILQPAGPQQFTRLQIIGVMKDFNIESMHKKITPVCFTVLGNFGGDQFAAVRISDKDIPGTIKAIEQKWQTYTTTQPFQYDFLTDSWNNLYSSEMKTGKIFLLFSILAVFIACLGLLGLVTFITNKRTREIGIRKTYGASIRIVLRLLSKEVVYLILISSVIAYPIAFFGSRYWLEGFADKVNINPLIYLSATLITLAVGWLSISYQTIKAANYNPANALRIE